MQSLVTFEVFMEIVHERIFYSHKSLYTQAIRVLACLHFFCENLNYDYLHKVAHEQVGLQAVWNGPMF